MHIEINIIILMLDIQMKWAKENMQSLIFKRLNSMKHGEIGYMIVFIKNVY